MEKEREKERGQGLVEYALIATLVLSVIAVAIWFGWPIIKNIASEILSRDVSPYSGHSCDADGQLCQYIFVFALFPLKEKFIRLNKCKPQ
jgi:hypothetical protein